MSMKNTEGEEGSASMIDFVSSMFADDSSSRQTEYEGDADQSTHLNFVTFFSCVRHSFRSSLFVLLLSYRWSFFFLENMTALNYFCWEDLSLCLCLRENIWECAAHSVELCFAVSHHDVPALFYVNIIAVIYSKRRVTYALVDEQRSKSEHCKGPEEYFIRRRHLLQHTSKWKIPRHLRRKPCKDLRSPSFSPHSQPRLSSLSSRSSCSRL